MDKREEAPMVRGQVRDWDRFENLLRHSFYEKLRVAPEEHPVLFIEQPLTPKPDREKLTQISFEKYVLD